MKTTIVKMKIKGLKMHVHFLLAGMFISLFLHAQNEPVYLVGGTIHKGNGQVLQQAHLLMQDGKIIEVSTQFQQQIKNAKIIDVTGKHLYPGIIAMNNIMGLNEIDAVRATRDYNEVGAFNSNVRTAIAYNTDSKILPTALFNGIVFTQAVPQGGQMSGSSSLFYTKAWNWEDALVVEDDGVHLNYPDLTENKANQSEEKSATEKQLSAMQEFFEAAYTYCQLAQPTIPNLRYEAMRKVFASQRNLYVHVSTAKGMFSALALIKVKYPSIALVFVGAEEAYQLIPTLKKYNIPVVLSNIHRLPMHNFEAYDLPYQLPAILHDSGIQVIIAQSGSWEARNVMFNAGTAVAYGMDKEQALSCITLGPAKLMHIDNKIGSLEIGKEATVLVSVGDILDMKSSKLEKVFIKGVQVEINDVQQALNKKYREKYQLKD
jgi:imidazolonepropionase-like amidohydrolase